MGRDGDMCLIGSENSVDCCRPGSSQNQKTLSPSCVVVGLDYEQDAVRETDLSTSSKIEQSSLNHVESAEIL